MAIRVISSDERQSRRAQMSVARRVTRPFRSAVRRARRHVPGMAMRYVIGPRARNAARVTFDTGLSITLGTRALGRTRPISAPAGALMGGGGRAVTGLAVWGRLAVWPPPSFPTS